MIINVIRLQDGNSVMSTPLRVWHENSVNRTVDEYMQSPGGEEPLLSLCCCIVQRAYATCAAAHRINLTDFGKSTLAEGV